MRPFRICAGFDAVCSIVRQAKEAKMRVRFCSKLTPRNHKMPECIM